MSNAGDPDTTRLLRDLTAELQRLQREVETAETTDPRPGDLSRFTSEVAIPGLILLLETNIRALQLLRKTIRLADGRAGARSTERSEVRARAESLGQTTLAKLDETLAELQSSLEGENGEMDELIDEARALQQEVRERLEQSDPGVVDGIPPEEDDRDAVDVDAELRAIKNDLDDEDGSPDEDSS